MVKRGKLDEMEMEIGEIPSAWSYKVDESVRDQDDYGK